MSIEHQPRPKLKRKERVLVACNRCKARKRKCDGNFPCKSCLAAQLFCTFDRPPVEAAEVNNIEIAELRKANEDLKREVERLNKMVAEDQNQMSVLQNKINGNQITQLSCSRKKEVSALSNNGRSPEMISEVEILSTISSLLHKRTREVDEYIGSFAVISIVKAIKKYLRTGTDTAENSPTILDTDFQENTYVSPHLEESFFTRFFSLSHNRHYFIDECWFYKILAKPDSEKTHWDLFAINIALGIGCRLTELLKVTIYPSPDMYFKKSLTYLAGANLTHIQQIQACLLIALFIGRSYHLSFYITSWELTGIAMRKLVQVGLHRKQPVTYETALEYEFNKRLFWSAYNYDKLLSLSLGRPGSINECFIDVPYPLSFEISPDPTPKDIYDLYHMQIRQEADRNLPQPITSFTTLIHTCMIRQVESRIHLAFYTVNDSIPIADSFDSIVADINDWYLSLPSRADFFNAMKARESYDYLELLYHRSRLILFLPKIMISQGSDDLLDQACLSAGGICTSYKNLYRDSVLEFSIVALHTVFLAGVTMVFYLQNKGYPTFMNMQTDIRACSSLLFVFSERWPEAKSYRDLFDDLLEKGEMVRRVHDEGSPAGPTSETIKNTNPGLQQVTTYQPHGTQFRSDQHSSNINDTSSAPPFSLDQDFWSHILLDIKLPATPTT
ncbi:hypothetical protein CANARDRAFT_8830 [[Candida] arabinofermentans NRRL YB-2248]|uniref:Zn(2)-C6 fungal-type domain-containing protein n=1 Tax=[Candida] arabinofermentans NRRL YB-2248 TaxID=983967 RepID=A0A1E4SXG7_9ASCO|nr:hypothetical protein CANARDRAFT_8830 [[Candida] arabinofermentans NRRL YB-2248]